MDLRKTLLTILAIFCVIASAGAACAADGDANLQSNYADDMSGYSGSQYDDGIYENVQSQDDTGTADDNSGYAGSQYQDDGGWAGSQYQDDGGWAGSQYNETLENGNATSQQAAGEPVNTTAPVAQNITANATNATTPHNMLATGNPIMALLAVGAVLGGFTILRRR